MDTYIYVSMYDGFIINTYFVVVLTAVFLSFF